MPADQINWGNGTWRAEAGTPPAAEVIIASDWAPIRDFDSIISKDPEAIYGDLLPELRRGDLRIVNLECPLVDNGKAVWKSGTVLKGMGHHIKGLTAMPVEIATLANNHVFDYGLDAFIRTRDLLAENHINTLGAGLTAQEAEEPFIAEINTLKIGLINFSEGEDLTKAGKGPGVFGWEVARVCELVGRLKSEVNAVMVICHAGVEYIPFPPPYIAEAFQRIADAGADVIIGHHPHVPQGMQIYNGVPICYSLGNFVFCQHTTLRYRKIGYLVKVGVASTGITGIRIIPYEILPDRLAVLKDEKFRQFMEELRAISLPLDDFAQIVHTWNAFLKYYGTDGFGNEINGIMEKLTVQPHKGAAMFRNRMTTLQHRHHLIDLMTRIMDGTLDDAPAWAMDLTDQWFTRENEAS